LPGQKKTKPMITWRVTWDKTNKPTQPASAKEGEKMSISIDVPGRDPYRIENIVFDLNGTLTTDGRLENRTRELLQQLSKKVFLYILTADTQNSASRLQNELGENVNVTVLEGSSTAVAKKEFIQQKNPLFTAAAGNGVNDMEMIEKAVLSIAVIGKEGCYPGLFHKADLVVNHIDDAIEMFLRPQRIKATLRG